MNHNELINNLRSLATLLEEAGNTDLILDYAYDVVEQTESLINDTIGYN